MIQIRGMMTKNLLDKTNFNEPQVVSTLLDKQLGFGSYLINFDASSLPSGMYFYKLTTDYFTQTKSMMLIK